MRGRSILTVAGLIAGAAVAALTVPVIDAGLAQNAPESLLPPGFGDPPPPADTPRTPAPAPAPTNVPASTPTAAAGAPGLSVDLAMPADMADNAAAEVALSEEELAAQQAKYDLPDSARRSLDRVGPLTPETRGLAANAFGRQSGQYLASLMKASHAPFASRWTSILLRRALLSATNTPRDIDGADYVAERAWLLLRMGEADAARMLVQSVDPDRFTPRLYAIAMQTYLATADPAGLCPLSAGALRTSKEPGWQMSRAICASFAGDQGSASGALNQAQRQGIARGIDYRLAEKVVGAGFNARRSVKIEWDGVDNLTAWRFGLATAVNVPIPDDLWRTAGTHVRAWEARAPVLGPLRRWDGTQIAARLGVFSSAALVDFYSAAAADPDATDAARDRAEALATAHTGTTPGARIDAMRGIWQDADGAFDYTGLIAVARAAAGLPLVPVAADDMVRLIGAMLSAGYDRSAARWAGAVNGSDDDGAQDAWALLALGAPSPVVDLSRNRVSAYIDASDGMKGQMLLAGLAGLNRLPAGEAASLAGDAGLSLAANTRWARAIGAAAQRGERGTVALLAAIGLQVPDWRRVPPAHLYHIVAALHRVGLDPEARMIAAEAITRL
ncbi:hypothetical protein [Sphingobium algorifonticola]|uniref:Lytic transglycosylase domain-containing protein n=1 Tax=Sphingobium algorifonticola TaxID=2008318 RepID=A0A437J5E5_9SPHN|nr:hypothetical protein [Sphingobium algorifonticola]RVT40160.1 hypothetical protein ENE74_12465 [Sphingobium algorifonticola]